MMLGTGTVKANLSESLPAVPVPVQQSQHCGHCCVVRHLKITAHLPVFDQHVVFSREISSQQRQNNACAGAPEEAHPFVIFMDS